MGIDLSLPWHQMEFTLNKHCGMISTHTPPLYWSRNHIPNPILNSNPDPKPNSKFKTDPKVYHWTGDILPRNILAF